MPTITEVAEQFFAACETGQGWDGCSVHCTPDATFSAQAEPLADIRTLRDYTEWMKWLLTVIPDGHYAVKSFATDNARNNVCAFGVFSGTNTGSSPTINPTGKRVDTDYVYVMEFEDARIRHMTKIWNAGWALKELGWG